MKTKTTTCISEKEIKITVTGRKNDVWTVIAQRKWKNVVQYKIYHFNNLILEKAKSYKNNKTENTFSKPETYCKNLTLHLVKYVIDYYKRALNLEKLKTI